MKLGQDEFGRLVRVESAFVSCVAAINRKKRKPAAQSSDLSPLPSHSILSRRNHRKTFQVSGL